MISMTYYPRCETFRFAWAVRFAFAGFGSARKRNRRSPRPAAPMTSRGVVGGPRGSTGGTQRPCSGDDEKVAKKRSQAPEIIGARNFVRARLVWIEAGGSPGRLTPAHRRAAFAPLGRLLHRRLAGLEFTKGIGPRFRRLRCARLFHVSIPADRFHKRRPRERRSDATRGSDAG